MEALEAIETGRSVRSFTAKPVSREIIEQTSRSVCANIAEAWRRRRYEAHFVSKLNDAESEAEETRVWIEFACRCGYLTDDQAQVLDDVYNRILGQLVRMMSKPKQWIIRG